jgi:hypothetical protein
MCNATNKNGLKCKLSKSYGEYCHKHSYLDDDFQPGALENIKHKRLNNHDKLSTRIQYYDWVNIIFSSISIFFK